MLLTYRKYRNSNQGRDMSRISQKERGQPKDLENRHRSFGLQPPPPISAPGEAPEPRTQGTRDKGEPALKKVRRSSVGAPLVSESDKEEPDAEESETEVGSIASLVRHSWPYYEHVSHRQERAQRETEKEHAQRYIQERRD